MFDIVRLPYHDKPTFYRELLQELSGIYTTFWLSDLANTSALLMAQLPALNWAGFYLNVDNQLKLGPFQGLVACTEIDFTRGVCGRAATLKQTVLVEDVHAFPGHIACDPRSRSEIVIPLVKEGELLGVLDLDSPEPGRFDREDQIGLESVVQLLLKQPAPWPKLSLK